VEVAEEEEEEEEEKEVKASARLLPLESLARGVLVIKVLLRAGACRPREKLARCITSLV